MSTIATSQPAPTQGSDFGLSPKRSGRRRLANTAFTPGMIQTKANSRTVNHRVAPSARP